jgi:general secretion pathway protein J
MNPVLFSCRKRLRNQRGFTLLELLVALAILGLVTALGASLLHLGARSWEKAYSSSEKTAAIETVQNLLRRELQCIHPTSGGTGVTAHTPFDGQATALSFISLLPEALQNDGPAEIHLFLKDYQDSKYLVMAWRHGGASASWSESILLPNVRVLHISYYGAETKDQSPRWQPVWSFQKTLPQAIKLEAELSTGVSWPTLIVTPMISMDVTCGYRSALEKCWIQ